jgi:c-di-GMP-related signal transduction protein
MTKKMSVNKYSKAIDKIIASKKPIVEQFMDLMGLLDVSFVDTTVNEKKSIPEYISDCCHAPIVAVSGILDTDTFHFECLKCRKACNPIKHKKFNLFETLKRLLRK